MNLQKTILLTSLIFLLGCSENRNDKTLEFDFRDNPPNILFAISDDQSFPHASAYGSKMLNTPAFDRVASDGILFMNAFVASPGCSPSRAAMLTGRTVYDIINLIDLAPTLLEAAGLEHPSKEYPMAGKSIMNILLSSKEGQIDPPRTSTFSARERHSSARWNNHNYPMRSVRTQYYLYIRNFKPDRWPAGAPQEILPDGTSGPMHGAYYDIDASPSLSYLTDNHDHPEVSKYFHLAVDKRPAEELYDIISDPGCLNNLANEPSYEDVLLEHRRKIGAFLMETLDPRVTGRGDIYEEFPRYGPMRVFPKP